MQNPDLELPYEDSEFKTNHWNGGVKQVTHAATKDHTLPLKTDKPSQTSFPATRSRLSLIVQA